MRKTLKSSRRQTSMSLAYMPSFCNAGIVIKKSAEYTPVDNIEHTQPK